MIISVREPDIAEIAPTNVSQGRTWENNEECCAAAYAIDYDFSTHALATTDIGTGWIKLHFDKTYYIDKVVVYYRFYSNWYDPNDDCVESEAMFRSCVDFNTNVDVSVYRGEVKQKSCGTLQLTYGLEQSDQIYTLLCYAEGDAVKFSKDEGHILVYEVVVVSSSGNIGKV